MRIIRFIKNWTLPISMLTGALSYFIYVSIPFLAPTKPFMNEAIAFVQPFLIFCMLFLTFCKVSPSDLHLRRWHLWLVLIQLFIFSLLAMGLVLFPQCSARVIAEGAMLCMICPTATAAAVVTSKLGGNTPSIITYTILINMAVAVVAPLLLPLAHPHAGLSFLPAFGLIIGKVFPMLICPLIVAWLIRYTLPSLLHFFQQFKDLAFYIWGVSLAIAIAVTVKAIVHSEVNVWYQVGIAIISLICCLFQFAVGKKIGTHYDERIEGGQALGQKNTVFIIWMGYTFLSPVTAVAGGFYSVWHNIINSYQLYQKRKEEGDNKSL